ncbi:MAG: hypothetical protein K1X51_14175 [Rhodospirillaceae bacterium]|nr:hypothetical protein [Rhodospirillaceae bacterium]
MKLIAILTFTVLTFPAAAAEIPAPAKLEAPGVVALQQETNGWVYRQFPTGLRLYVSDKDTGGKSNCNRECAFAWPPLYAEPDSKPTGDWTVIKRDEGKVQWAYKKRPVYMLFHDDPHNPAGNGQDGGAWHLLEP